MGIRQVLLKKSDDWTNAPESLALPLPVLAGSTILVAIDSHQYMETSGVVNGISDGAAYTNIAAFEDTNISKAWLDVWYRPNVSAGTITPVVSWKVSNANNRAAIVVMEISGVTSAPLDQVATAVSYMSTTSMTVGPTGTLAQAAETVVLIAGGQINGLALPGGSPYTQQAVYQMSGDNVGILAASMSVASTSAVSGSVQYNTAPQGVNAVLVTFKETTGGQRIRGTIQNPSGAPILGSSGWAGRIFNGATQVAQYTGGSVASALTSGTADGVDILIPATGLGLANGAAVTFTGENSTHGIVGEASGTVEAGTV